MKTSIKKVIFGAARAVLFTTLIFAAQAGRAAVPELINFQGKLMDSAGTAVTSPVSMVFKFYTAATGGSYVWTETQNVTPDSAGLYSVLLGSATPFSAYSISFSTAYWLGVTVGADLEMTPRYKIVSSAYSLYSIYSGTASYSVNSGTAAWASGTDWTDVMNKPAFSAGDVYLASTQTFTGTNTMTAETYFSSNVSVGTLFAPSALTVTGTFMYSDGSAAAGKVLTSDVNGLASWQPAGGGDVYLASTQTFTGTNTMTAETYFSSNVSVGTLFAPSALTVTGTFMYSDGSAAAGKVLTSDVNGLASWQPAGGGGGDVYKASTQTFTGENTFMGNTYFSSAAYFTNGGIYSTGAVGGVAFSGAGTRFMWVPEKKAVRAGEAAGTEWNSGSIGNYSVAFGYANTASGLKSIAAGGEYNTASNQSAAVPGGSFNTASGQYSTVGGGVGNTASNTSAAVSGGQSNTASGLYAIVSGGTSNIAGDRATVGGGESNVANATYATASGGKSNTASYYAATVAGGQGNTASNTYATVAGGDGNTANGAYSFAAGRGSSSTVEGTFTWSDSDGTEVDNDVFNRTWFKNRGGFLVTASTNPADGGMFLNGNNYVGIGTTVPTSTLTVVGTFKLTDGSQGTGKVLTSDAVGAASWAAPSGPVYAVTTADNTNITPTLHDIPDLSISLAGNAKYELEAELSCAAGPSANGLQYAVGFTAVDAGVEAVITGPISSIAMKNSRITAINTASSDYLTEVVLTGGIFIKGIITTTTAGTLTIQDSATNPGSSTVYKNSYLKVTKI